MVAAPNLAAAADGEPSLLAEGWPLIALAVTLASVITAIYYRRKWTADGIRLVELRSGMARQSDLLGSAPVDFISWSHDGVEEVSSGLARIVGPGKQGAPGSEDLVTLFSPETRAELEATFEEFRTTGLPFERVLGMADGSRTLRLIGGAGRTGWIVDETCDAAALETELTGLRRLLDFLPIPLWRLDENLELDYANVTYRNAVAGAADAAPETLGELGAGAIAQNGRALAERAARERAEISGTHHVVMAGRRRLVKITEGRSATMGRSPDTRSIALRPERSPTIVIAILPATRRCCTNSTPRSQSIMPTKGSSSSITPSSIYGGRMRTCCAPGRP